MPKSNVLQYNRVMMTVVGIYPQLPTSSSYLNRLASISPYLIIPSMVVAETLSSTYVYQGFNTTRLSYVFEAFSLVFGGTSALSAYLNMRWNMDDVADLQLKFQQIVDQGTQ